MALRFRKSIKILPGLRLNLSKDGITANVGVKGANVSVGKRGTFLNLGLPGTGVGYRERISQSTNDEVQNLKSPPGRPGFLRG